MTGTLLNVGAIVAGASVGMLLGGRLPARVRSTVTDVLGLFVAVLGIHDAMRTFGDGLSAELGRAAVLVVLGSLLVGGVIGEAIDLERRLEQVGTWLRDLAMRGRETMPVEASGPDRATLAQDHPPHDPRHRFVEGFVICSLVVCVGPLAILGSLQDGLTGDYQLLAVKSLLDAFAALAFAAALGVGVAFAALPLFLWQGGITLLAGALEGAVTPVMIEALTAVGGFLVVGIGLRLLEIRAVRVANLLPALLIAPLAVRLWP